MKNDTFGPFWLLFKFKNLVFLYINSFIAATAKSKKI